MTVRKKITVNGGNNNWISNVTSMKRIYLEYGSSNYVYKVTANHSDAYDIEVYNDLPNIYDFVSTRSKLYSIYACQYAYPDFDGCQLTDKDYAIWLAYHSQSVIEDVYFCQNSPYDIYAGSYCYADAYYDDNVFSGDPEETTSGDVSYPWDWEECGLRKAAAKSTASATLVNTAAVEGDDPGWNEYLNAASVYKSIKQKLRSDFKRGEYPQPQKYAADYSSALDKFKQVVAKYPGAPSSMLALGRVAGCYWELGQPEAVRDYLNSIIKGAGFEALMPHAMSLMIPYRLYKGEYEQALQLSDEILASRADPHLACEVLYGKGIIYQYYLNDLQAALISIGA